MTKLNKEKQAAEQQNNTEHTSRKQRKRKDRFSREIKQ